MRSVRNPFETVKSFQYLSSSQFVLFLIYSRLQSSRLKEWSLTISLNTKGKWKMVNVTSTNKYFFYSVGLSNNKVLKTNNKINFKDTAIQKALKYASAVVNKPPLLRIVIPRYR